MSGTFVRRAGVTSALLMLTIGAANAGEYTWSEIVVPSLGPIGNAFGLNNKGQVALVSADGSKSGIYRAGTFTPLPPPPAGYKVTATCINDGGTIVGWASSPSDPMHEQGFVLVGSTYTFFSRPGWENTEPRAIANSGLITGWNFTSDLSTNAGFVYSAGTNAFTDVTPPGSGTGVSITQGINADGRITGDGRSDELGRYAFVWQQGTLVKGTQQLAPFLDRLKIANANTAARGINDNGVIVGFTGFGAGFVGSDSRGFQLLIAPGGDAPGANVACEGINNLRQVVCGVTDSAGNVRDFIGTPPADNPNNQ